MSERRSAPWWLSLAWGALLVAGGLVGWYLYLSADTSNGAVDTAGTVQAAQPIPIHITITDATSSSSPPSSPSSSSAQGKSAPAATRNVVVARNGAIVFIGDHGVLKANTGKASASGVIAIDANESTFSTGAAVRDAFSESLTGRAVAVEGYENHSVNVAGNDLVSVYDDSNLFINRNGQINANTGDTDSSGLNAVDVTRSFVRSGDSTDEEDDENGNGEPEEPEEPDEEAFPLAASTASRGSTGSASAMDDDSSATVTGRDPLLIGGDGYDDLAVRNSGNRNIVVYDDSNVVIGGTGGVNAEIGDSDTGGAVVMGIVDSHVEAGRSS